MALLTVIASALLLALLQWRPQPDPVWPALLTVLACGSAQEIRSNADVQAVYLGH